MMRALGRRGGINDDWIKIKDITQLNSKVGKLDLGHQHNS
jgi:hypothetical protein